MQSKECDHVAVDLRPPCGRQELPSAACTRAGVTMPPLLVVSAHAAPNHRGRPADAACRAVVCRLALLALLAAPSQDAVAQSSQGPPDDAALCVNKPTRGEFALCTSHLYLGTSHFALTFLRLPRASAHHTPAASRATSVRAPARPNINRLSLRCRALAS